MIARVFVAGLCTKGDVELQALIPHSAARDAYLFIASEASHARNALAKGRSERRLTRPAYRVY
jgi:hypothetical protein